MKKIGLFVAAVMGITACYNDTAIVERLDKQAEEISGLKDDVRDLRGDVDFLKEEIGKLNSNILGLRGIVEAMQNNDFVTGVTSVKDAQGNIIGYTITFTVSDPITIYHGKDGEKGETGASGDPGEDGHSPVIGVKESGGKYYWTVDGKFITDAQGHPVPVTGENGRNGENGQNGEPGKTPQIRINAGNWEIRWSDDEDWTVLAPASTSGGGGSADNIFSAVKETKSAVVFTLADGSRLTIEKLVDFYINIDDSITYEVVQGATLAIPYTLTGAASTSRVDALASGEWWAEASCEDYESGSILITAGSNPDAKVLVYASDGKGRTDIRTITFTSGIMQVSFPSTNMSKDGGEIEIPVVTNVDYTVDIQEDAKSWVSSVVTKAGEVRHESLLLTADPNKTPEARTGTVCLKDSYGSTVQTISITQESGIWTEPQFEDSVFRTWLLTGTPGLDRNSDGHLSSSEVALCTTLTITDNFSSLSGIECLYNLKSFTLTENSGAKLARLDVSGNAKLESITVTKQWQAVSALEEVVLGDLKALRSIQLGTVTGIKSVQMGNMPSLETFSAYNTSISSIDLSRAPNLVSLAVYGTQLQDLDVSRNPKLVSLNAGTSTLRSLKLGDNRDFTYINIDNAPLTGLDFSSFTRLTYFSAAATKLEKIDLGNCADLTSFSVGTYGTGSSEMLKVVDLRKAVKLTSCNLYSSALEKVILPKGIDTGNFNWTTYIYDRYDEIQYVQYEYIDVEDGSNSDIEDYAALVKDSFVRKVVLGKFDKDGDGKISPDEAAAVKTLDFTECDLSDGDLDGLEAFPLEKLLLDGNKFTSFDGALYPSLRWVSINRNKLVSINLPDYMQHVEAARNRIASAGIPATYSSLEYIDLSDNALSAFSHQYNSNLRTVKVADNQIETFSVYGCGNIVTLDCSGNKISNISGFSGLEKVVNVNVSGNALSDTSYYGNAGITFNSAQTSIAALDLSDNDFVKLDISPIVGNPGLHTIDLRGNMNFNLLIIGSGNSISEGTGILADTQYGVLAAVNPTRELKTNRYGFIDSFEASDGVKAINSITVNYSLSASGYLIPAGESLTIVSAGSRKTIRYYAVGLGGTPTVTLSRADKKKIYTSSDNSTLAPNPFTTRNNVSAAEDNTSFIVDGNGDHCSYYFGPTNGSSGGGLSDGDKVTIKVSGNEGESVIVFGINLETYTDDDYGWM